MAGIMSEKERADKLDRVRKQMEKDKGSSRKDPHEFRPSKAEENQELNYYFRILPELNKGETCESGVSTNEYDVFFYKNGAHWIDRQKIECPRIHDDSQCPICALGFDLMNETKDDEARRGIARKFLPRTYYAVNIYFLNTSDNPEELRGKVMWLSAGKTIYDVFESCIHNDDPGSEMGPKAYGIFYDCYEGYVFRLRVKKKGDWNNYDNSEFVVKTRGPLSKNSEGTLDEKAAQEILDKRHDICGKFDDRDIDKLNKAVARLAGDDSDSDGGFDVDEEKTVKEEPVKAKEEPVKEEPVKEEPVKEEPVDELVAATSEAPKEESVKEEPVASGGGDDEDEELANLLADIKESKN